MNYLSAVDDCFIDSPGGMARVAWDVALALRDRGHDVSMLCAKGISQKDLASVSEANGIRIVRYDRPVLPRWHPRRADRLIAAAADAALSYLGSEKWDIIHMHSPFTGTGVVKAIAPGARLVYTMHSPFLMEQQINWNNQGIIGKVKLVFGQGILKRIEGGLLHRCDGIQTLSQFTRDQIERYYGIGSSVTVIPHWRRPELKREYSKQAAREQLGWPANEKIIFTLRHLGPRNGVDIGIRSISPLAKQNECWFMIGGSGPLRPAFERLTQELNASHRIKFLGRLSDQDLNLAYQAADLFLLPTLALECFGLIILEAFAFGCPVLCTDAGAIPESVAPIMPGFIVPAGNVKALQEKIKAFLAGQLVPPSSEELVNYTHKRFDSSVVFPSLLKLLGVPAGSSVAQVN